MITPPIPILLPLAVAILLVIVPRVPRFLASLVALLTTTGVLFAAIAIAVFARDATYIVWSAGRSPFGLFLVIDGTGAMLAILASLLTLAAILFSYRYCSNARGRYHALLLGLLGGMCGFCETGELGNMVLFFAIMGATAFGLCRHDPEAPARPAGARKFAIAAGTGAAALLLAAALLFGRTGSLDMAQVGRSLTGQPDITVASALVLSFCGFFLLAAIVPFHFWISDAHAIAPAPVCALLAGILVELGLYGAVRMYFIVFSGAMQPWQNDIRAVLLVWGAITAVAGAFLAYRQRNLKRMLAFSTVSQMGVLLMAVALLTPGAMAGAAIAVMGHAFLKAALFLAAGIVLHRFASLDEVHLLGRGRHLRWTGTLFFVAAAGLVGLPPFGIFWGNVMMNAAASGLGFGWVAWVAVAASVVANAAIFRFAAAVFLGWAGRSVIEATPSTRNRGATPPSLYAAATLLLVLGLLAGLIPGLTGTAYGAAIRIQDRVGYQQRVIDLLVPYPPTVHDQPATGADVAVALAAVFSAALLGTAGAFKTRRFTESPGR